MDDIIFMQKDKASHYLQAELHYFRDQKRARRAFTLLEDVLESTIVSGGEYP